MYRPSFTASLAELSGMRAEISYVIAASNATRNILANVFRDAASPAARRVARNKCIYVYSACHATLRYSTIHSSRNKNFSCDLKCIIRRAFIVVYSKFSLLLYYIINCRLTAFSRAFDQIFHTFVIMIIVSTFTKNKSSCDVLRCRKNNMHRDRIK